MHKVFVNGLSAKSGGGKSIITNYLRMLSGNMSEVNYIVLVPDKSTFQFATKGNIKLIQIPKIWTNKLFFPFVYSFILPRVLKKQGIDIVFNLADIPIKTNVKQVFLFDWSYAVYPKSEVWKMMSLGDYLVKKSKLYFFKKFAKHIDVLIAQTDTMRKHLSSLYGIQNIEVIPNAVSLDNLSGGMVTNYNFPSGLKFLYLTHYYPHKNLEIFLELAKRIKAQNLDFKLITTLDPEQHKGASEFLADIKGLDLENIILNVGAVKMENVPSLYKQCDALLMPTLLESFSGTYVEAMFHKIPILTSKYDFARDVCQNAAIYFDPHDADEILTKMKNLSDSVQVRERLVLEGSDVLSRMPDWNEAFNMYNKIIKSLI
jgi:glycosyltransferase involved in cell wall biosynthesis